MSTVNTVPVNEDEELCAICHCEYKDSCVRQPPCNHVFHRACLDKWEEQSNDCPTCRQPLKPEDVLVDKLLIDISSAMDSLTKSIDKLSKLDLSLSKTPSRTKDVIYKHRDLEIAYDKLLPSLTRVHNSHVISSSRDTSVFPEGNPFAGLFPPRTAPPVIDTPLPESNQLASMWEELQRELFGYLNDEMATQNSFTNPHSPF